MPTIKQKENGVGIVKKLIIILLYLNFSFASDPITLDSLFKKQLGIRSISNFRVS